MSNTFNNVDDLMDFLQENPSIAFEQNIGCEVDIECPICNKETVAVISTAETVKCKECNKEIQV